MPCPSSKKLRGISEYVSAMLLAIIVLAVGGVVVSRIIEDAYTARHLAEKQLVEAITSARQDLVIALAYIDKGSILHLVVATGDMPSTLYDVYVNGTLWSSKCFITASNESMHRAVHGAELPPYTVAIVECELPEKASFARVKLTYSGGEVYAEAGKP